MLLKVKVIKCITNLQNAPKTYSDILIYLVKFNAGVNDCAPVHLQSSALGFVTAYAMERVQSQYYAIFTSSSCWQLLLI